MSKDLQRDLKRKRGGGRKKDAVATTLGERDCLIHVTATETL